MFHSIKWWEDYRATLPIILCQRSIYILYIQIRLSDVKLYAEFTNVGIFIFKKRSFCRFQNGFDFDTNHQNIKTLSFKLNIHVRLIFICRFNLLSTMANWTVNYILPLANITKPLLEYFYHQNLLKVPAPRLVCFGLLLQQSTRIRQLCTYSCEVCRIK